MEKYFEANKSLWNNKTKIHVQSAFYDNENFKKGKDSLNAIERELLGDVAGKKILHLQCHFGQDTLSLARTGAEVTGVDFSSEAIATAKKLAKEIDVSARFIESNIYDLPQVLNEEFDIVFTTYGTICWLPDVDKWAAIIQKYLKKGGKLVFVDFHPTLDILDFNTLQISYDYFTTEEPNLEFSEGTYADMEAPIKQKEYFWNHAVSEILTALINQGLQIEKINEYDYSPYNCFPNMMEREKGKFVFKNMKNRFPYIISVVAHR